MTNPLGPLPKIPARFHERAEAKADAQAAITRAIMDAGLSGSEAVSVLAQILFRYAQKHERPPQRSEEE